MKKLIISILVTLLMITGFTSFESARSVQASDVYFTYYAKNDFVARTGRGTQYPSAGRVPFQSAFAVKKGGIINGWAEIIVNGKKVYAQYSNIVNKKPTHPVYFQYYAKEAVSFYADRSLKSKRFGSIAEDAIIPVAKGTVINDWVEIKFKGQKYYVEYNKVTPKAPTYFTYYSTNDFTLYNERHTKTPKLQVPYEAVVKVKKGSVINGWSRIEYNGVKGYAPYNNISSKKPIYFNYYVEQAVNYYSSKSTSSELKGSLGEDTLVRVKKGTVDNGWVEVKISGNNYYSDYSKLTNRAPVYFTYYANRDFKLFEARNTSKSLVNVPTNAQVKVKKGSVINGWSRIEYKGIKGYAPYDYISNEKPGHFIYYANKTTNIYSSTNTSTGVMGTIKKNDPVKIQIGSIKNGWAVVSEYNGKDGYIKASDIVNKPFYYAREILELRQKKSAKSNRILSIAKGEEVTVLNRAELFQDWVLVRYNGKTGYVSSRYLTLEKVAKDTPLSKIIVIDPGHGGKDPGAIGNGLRESDVNLTMGKRTASKLSNMGYEVHLTRTEDVFLALNERTEFAYNLSPGVFISLHMNAVTNPDVDGTETYSTVSAKSLTPAEKADSDKLAAFIQNRLVEAIKTDDRGTKKNDFYVIDKNYTRSVLIEMGFISNPEDANIFKTESGQDKTATAIANGINDFYKWKNGK
ncbi:N-acetylmuramoyl-L-alanine amidase [Metabacillus crassostreae]|uniref:N-acetylmuramoyl-L-alanine amidase n=1 Tax=Metabacillus crassostreae TaxID=929098 RepID=UPI00195841D6|nr:N-acetylmuramoyl-L-alanine amidase [Metabacillus crassostreae]MBM7606270.1 N-acetylmuramoyl-L-alanine amidase [Metabacillus crassostreae]